MTSMYFYSPMSHERWARLFGRDLLVRATDLETLPQDVIDAYVKQVSQ